MIANGPQPLGRALGRRGQRHGEPDCAGHAVRRSAQQHRLPRREDPPVRPDADPGRARHLQPHEHGRRHELQPDVRAGWRVADADRRFSRRGTSGSARSSTSRRRLWGFGPRAFGHTQSPKPKTKKPGTGGPGPSRFLPFFSPPPPFPLSFPAGITAFLTASEPRYPPHPSLPFLSLPPPATPPTKGTWGAGAAPGRRL